MGWEPDFCLVCETQTNGSVYCTMVCQMADYEKQRAVNASSFPKSYQSASLQSQSQSLASDSKVVSKESDVGTKVNLKQSLPSSATISDMSEKALKAYACSLRRSRPKYLSSQNKSI